MPELKVTQQNISQNITPPLAACLLPIVNAGTFPSSSDVHLTIAGASGSRQEVSMAL